MQSIVPSTAMQVTDSRSIADDHEGFLAYLRNQFTYEEASAFLTTYAIHLHGKSEEFCSDLDVAYKWMGYAQKVKAVGLLKRSKLKEGTDFLLSRHIVSGRAQIT